MKIELENSSKTITLSRLLQQPALLMSVVVCAKTDSSVWRLTRLHFSKLNYFQRSCARKIHRWVAGHPHQRTYAYSTRGRDRWCSITHSHGRLLSSEEILPGENNRWSRRRSGFAGGHKYMKSRLLSTKKHRANASALGAESSRPWRIKHENWCQVLTKPVQPFFCAPVMEILNFKSIALRKAKSPSSGRMAKRGWGRWPESRGGSVG